MSVDRWNKLNISKSSFSLLSILVAAGMTASDQSATASPISSQDLDYELARSFLMLSSPIFNMRQLAEPSARLDKKSVSQLPWSSSFLPSILGYSQARGVTSGADVFFLYPGPRISEFLNHRYQQQQTFSTYMSEANLRDLSSAEKYDLITGHIGTPKGLSYNLIRQAEQRDELGNVAFWTGMCNGWSPAAINVPRPLHKIHVRSHDGRRVIPFYPEDIKQLFSTLYFNTSTLWATTNKAEFSNLGYMPMVGNRCRERSVELDETGTAVAPECDDLDPGLWHILAVNMIGIADKAFVADMDAARAVSNYPVRGYEIKYFNPKTGENGSFAQSSITRSSFPQDIYARHRNARAHSIVGVEMKVLYTKYRPVGQDETDSPANDDVADKTFTYDIEMAADGTIVGGSWRINKSNSSTNFIGMRINPDHPDFIWYPPSGISNGSVAVLPSAGKMKNNTFRNNDGSSYELIDLSRIGFTGDYDAAATGNWHPADDFAQIPESWHQQSGLAAQSTRRLMEGQGNSAKWVNQYNGQPLAKILYKLLEASRDEQEAY